MIPHEKAETVISYAVGGAGMSLPFVMKLLEFGTNLFTFLAAFIGFLVVYSRWLHDRKKRKKDR